MPLPTGRAAARAKLFRNGHSQAVRLPKAFRFPGDEVLIHRAGNTVILEPLPGAWDEELRTLVRTPGPLFSRPGRSRRGQRVVL